MFSFTLPGGGLFGGPPALPPPPPPVPERDDPSVVQKKEAVRLAAQRTKGFGSTNKTSGLGDETEANVNQRMLK
jgi:hypothetical protein